MAILHVKADIFTQTTGILVHACNTKGSWGAGISLAFRERFPAAFEVYRDHCKQHGPELAGTCLLISGTADDAAVDIACLFTSRAYGKRKDEHEDILRATRTAVESLMEQNTQGKVLHACRINSGRFGVPWQDTEVVLLDLGVDMRVYEAVTEFKP